MRDPLNIRRLKLVEKAWKKIDSSNSGFVDKATVDKEFQAVSGKDGILHPREFLLE